MQTIPGGDEVVTDGPDIKLWDALGAAMWITSVLLLAYDAFAYSGAGMGPLTPWGGLTALIAVCLTVAGIARRAVDVVVSQMDNAFKMGQESVRRISR